MKWYTLQERPIKEGDQGFFYITEKVLLPPLFATWGNSESVVFGIVCNTQLYDKWLESNSTPGPNLVIRSPRPKDFLDTDYDPSLNPLQIIDGKIHWVQRFYIDELRVKFGDDFSDVHNVLYWMPIDEIAIPLPKDKE